MKKLCIPAEDVSFSLMGMTKFGIHKAYCGVSEQHKTAII